jgi:ATPase subunit of ABC transporter with duplicated ATPase domains
MPRSRGGDLRQRATRGASTQGDFLMTANQALEIAETMSNGEAAQLALAAELLGVSEAEFFDMLIEEDIGD